MPNELTRYEESMRAFFTEYGARELGSCFLCKGKSEKQFDTWYTPIYNCECGLVYSYYQPARYVLDMFYESENMKLWADFKLSDPRQIPKFQPVVDYLKSLGVKSVCDLGCGSGTFVNLCLEAGIKAVGVDKYVPNAGPFIKKDINAFLEEDHQYECITLWGVLEHVRDPIQLLEKITTKLIGPKLLVVCVPNVASAVVKTYREECFTFCPQHLWHFSSLSLTKTLQKAGYKIDTWTTIEGEVEPIFAKQMGLPNYSKIPIPEPYKTNFIKHNEEALLMHGMGYKLVFVAKL